MPTFTPAMRTSSPGYRLVAEEKCGNDGLRFEHRLAYDEADAADEGDDQSGEQQGFPRALHREPPGIPLRGHGKIARGMFGSLVRKPNA